MSDLEGTRVGVIYDCLFPHTLGGAERWYREVADAAASRGAHVSYLTRRQWTREHGIEAFEVVAVSPQDELYDTTGNRRIVPALRFGVGVFRWLVRHRRSYDVVHAASFPFFSLLAARLALVATSTPVVVDYHEVWHRPTWRRYSGRLTGTIGHEIQRLCIFATHRALVFTRATADKLVRYRRAIPVEVLPGLLPQGLESVVAHLTVPETPRIIFVGRHIEDKGIDQLPDVIELLLARDHRARLLVVGDGPGTAALRAQLRRRALDHAVDFVGRVSDERRDELLATSSCLILPSRREGYGIVVAEACAAATPAVVSDHEDNLATGLIADGVNGFVCAPDARAMAEAVGRVLDAGEGLRRSTRRWFDAAAGQTRDASVERVLEIYQEVTNPNQGETRHESR